MTESCNCNMGIMAGWCNCNTSADGMQASGVNVGTAGQVWERQMGMVITM